MLRSFSKNSTRKTQFSAITAFRTPEVIPARWRRYGIKRVENSLKIENRSKVQRRACALVFTSRKKSREMKTGQNQESINMCLQVWVHDREKVSWRTVENCSLFKTSWNHTCCFSAYSNKENRFEQSKSTHCKKKPSPTMNHLKILWLFLLFHASTGERRKFLTLENSIIFIFFPKF